MRFVDKVFKLNLLKLHYDSEGWPYTNHINDQVLKGGTFHTIYEYQINIIAFWLHHLQVKNVLCVNIY